ncbi:hypothetical protein R50072_10820 [Simiduia litorea]|uniref:DUF6694 family lipoprotein n=1 Tax=Simiduia litorea TaxID=1435348 RepID=UPI0036F2E973
MKKTILVLIFPFIMSCQDRLDASNRQSFEASREKLEQSLDESQRVNLEKAMRVVALEATRLKFEGAEEHQGRSIDEISLAMVDGLSYVSAAELAEGILKKRNAQDIIRVSGELARLNRQKLELEDIISQLDFFSVASVRLSGVDFFGELTPALEVDYQFVGNHRLLGTKEIAYKISQLSTNNTIAHEVLIEGDSDSVLEGGDIIKNRILMVQARQANPKFWHAQTYPVDNPNLSDYDIKLDVSVHSLIIDGEKTSFDKDTVKSINAEIEEMKSTLAELSAMEGSLDELELIDD